MKKILITGGTGFLGENLVRRLYGTVNLRVLARNEGKLIQLKEKYPEIEIYPGDIADPFVCKQACNGVDGILHLAGFKHVGLAEKFTKENIDTNVIGSINILDATLGNDIEYIVGISTDKAAQVSGSYGASKLLMERLFRQYEAINGKCKYRIVRYGNVLYSTGSVVPKWREIIESGGTIKVTDMRATRFFWTVDDAIDLIFDCLDKATNSSPYCPSMKAMTVHNLLEALVIKYGKPGNIPVEEIGLQPGENLHEKILENGPYSNEVEQFTVEEIMRTI